MNQQNWRSHVRQPSVVKVDLAIASRVRQMQPGFAIERERRPPAAAMDPFLERLQDAAAELLRPVAHGLEELARLGLPPTTIRTYLHALRTCERYHRDRRLDQLGTQALRRYHAHLFREKKLAVGTVGLHVAALRFFFVRVLKRRELKEELPTPKRHRRLPTVLSPDEVRQLIAGAKNPTTA